MNLSLRAYLQGLGQFPQAAMHTPQQYFRRLGRDFTRARVLHLERVVWMVVGLLKSTLSVEIDKFFSWLGSGVVFPTKSALVPIILTLEKFR